VGLRQTALVVHFPIRADTFNQHKTNLMRGLVRSPRQSLRVSPGTRASHLANSTQLLSLLRYDSPIRVNPRNRSNRFMA
jgi:hypothetical protein